jgi:hypothetical protein
MNPITETERTEGQRQLEWMERMLSKSDNREEQINLALKYLKLLTSGEMFLLNQAQQKIEEQEHAS